MNYCTIAKFLFSPLLALGASNPIDVLNWKIPMPKFIRDYPLDYDDNFDTLHPTNENEH